VQNQILGIDIVKATRDQKVTFKIINSNILKASVVDIIVHITNQSFEVWVQQSNTSYKIPF
jgi:hypothetical protein